MKHFRDASNEYLRELNKRNLVSRVYRPYQFIGLEIAMLLNDLKHKSLYIKLAKDHDKDYLLQLAKSVAEKKAIANKGAYFMTVLSNSKTNENPSSR
jgi:hypothetical protein